MLRFKHTPRSLAAGASSAPCTPMLCGFFTLSAADLVSHNLVARRHENKDSAMSLLDAADPLSGWALSFSAGQLRTTITPTWRLTIEYEENGAKRARITVDCAPNDALRARMARRIDEGMPTVAEGLMWETMRAAANQILFQVLGESGSAEDHLMLGTPGAEATAITISSSRLGPYDGSDQLVYLRDIPRIVDQLLADASAGLSHDERAKARMRSAEGLARLREKTKNRQVQRVILSANDPIHFFYRRIGRCRFSGWVQRVLYGRGRSYFFILNN